MSVGETLQADRELDITGANDVLNLEVSELGLESKLLNDASIFARREFRGLFTLCTRDDHFARRKDQSGGLWVANAHDHGGEALTMKQLVTVAFRTTKAVRPRYLWVVLGIPGMKSDGLQVELGIQVHSSNNVSD